MPLAGNRKQTLLKHISKLAHNQDSRFPITPAIQLTHYVDFVTEMGETMMMGLRLTQEGVPTDVFRKRFGQSIQAIYGTQIVRLISTGLLEWHGKNQDVLRLTSKGRFLGNQVFKEFV
jgi:oxygen-independent coproporphyrinogen-3 oxidase